jgi:hypothetical protein
MRCDLVRTSALVLAAASALPPPNRSRNRTPARRRTRYSSTAPWRFPARRRTPIRCPRKFSAKNAADDKLITIAYTFKTLTDEERRAIYQALKGQPAAAFNADVGTELPPGVELHPVPNEVAARVPQTGRADDSRLTTGEPNMISAALEANEIHFVQEDSPDEIGRAIAGWMGTLG